MAEKEKEKKKGFLDGLLGRLKKAPEKTEKEGSDKASVETLTMEPDPETLEVEEESIEVDDKPEAPSTEKQEKQEKNGFIEKVKTGWFKRLKDGLDKTRKSFVFKMKGLFRLRKVIDEDFWDELEEILISADVGLETTAFIIKEMKRAVDEHYISEPSHLYQVMKDKLQLVLDERSPALNLASTGPSVIMIVGVNGTGKTTSIAKISNKFLLEKKKVVVAAADTFRAAAIEQLEVWAGKLGFEMIRHKEGSDPAAVVFDAVSAAQARKAEILIIDTAGRLHSKVNLMKELEKINRVAGRNIEGAPHETLLVLDATNGQNALIQAKTFSESVNISGIVLTKLDGTAKGGIIIGIVHQLGIPVKFIGIGEKVDDLRPFDSRAFLDALFSDDSETAEAT